MLGTGEICFGVDPFFFLPRLWRVVCTYGQTYGKSHRTNEGGGGYYIISDF